MPGFAALTQIAQTVDAGEAIIVGWRYVPKAVDDELVAIYPIVYDDMREAIRQKLLQSRRVDALIVW